MKTNKYVLTAIAAVALGGCANSDNLKLDDELLNAPPAQSGTPFTQALTKEYRNQMIIETDTEKEWDDAAFFADKGLRAARGELVLPSMPEAVQEWTWRTVRHGDLGEVIQIPDGRVSDLAAARFRLMAYLDGGGRMQNPLLAAHAQGLYDCWLEEEWEEEEASGVTCGSEFLQTESQFILTQTSETPTPISEQNRTVEYAPKMDTFEIFFDFDKSVVGVSSLKIINQVAESAKQHGTSTIINLTGHTDSSGSDAYNQKLSERRAKAVMDKLIKSGVSSVAIHSVGVGKDGQLVPTADGVREPQNRRTEIQMK